MYPTTGYTREPTQSQIECNKFETNIALGRERAEYIARERIAYLFEIGHAETARALMEKIDGRLQNK